jgi:hypothetical protein
VPADVVCLRGNHEAWMLEPRDDHTRHSWLLGMKALTTIRSYSAEAAEALGAAAADARGRLYDDGHPLPYELFFDAMPAAHRAFFDTLREVHETPECVCAHGGLNPALESLAGRPRLIWARTDFRGLRRFRPVVYGHHNNARVDDDDWPHPRIVGATYGLDTTHGADRYTIARPLRAAERPLRATAGLTADLDVRQGETRDDSTACLSAVRRQSRADRVQPAGGAGGAGRHGAVRRRRNRHS